MNTGMDAKTQREYRTKLYTDLYTGIIPERFPVQDNLSMEFLIQYAGKDLLTTQYTMNAGMLIEIYEKAREITRGDKLAGGFARNPISLMLERSRTMTMSKTGMIQHPESSFMHEDEYEEFTKNPHEFILEKIVPRTHESYAQGEVMRAIHQVKSALASKDSARESIIAQATMNERYGYFSPPPGSVASQSVPFDYLADMNRGFSQIPMDIRRRPQQVLDAMEALVPYLVWRAQNSVTSPLGANLIMTHMATFLNMKDFEKFYWPTFYKICHICAERGQAMQIFCEDDWTRFIDHLSDLPQGTRIYMEYGDAQKFKDKLGKKMVLGGFYPITLLKSGTKQECIDKAKELIDILAPGGNYFFCFDKSALHLEDINPENYVAVMEYVLENGKYDNAGQQVTTAKKEDSIKKFAHTYPEFQSKYYIPFDEFKKVYPPVSDKAEPLMRAAYEKYSNAVDRARL